MLRNLALRIVINAFAIALVVTLLPGIHIVNNDLGTLLIIAVIFGVLNAIVKPILTLLTCPVVLITFGLFILVINGVMLMLTASLSGGRLTIDNFGWAVLGGIIMSVVGMILERVLGVDEE